MGKVRRNVGRSFFAPKVVRDGERPLVRRTLRLLLALPLLAGAFGTLILQGGQSAGSSTPSVTTVSFTQQGCSTWVVPYGVNSVQVDAVGAAGASGGAAGGHGDEETATIVQLTPSQTSFDVCVDEGGGAGGAGPTGSGGAGGGASGVSLGATFGDPLVVAAGGGGGGGHDSCNGSCGSGGGGNAGAPGSAGATVIDTFVSGNGIGGGGATPNNVGSGGDGSSVNGGYDGSDGNAFTVAGPGVGGRGGGAISGSGAGGGGGGYNGGGGGGAPGNGFGGAGGGGGVDYCSSTYTSGPSAIDCSLTSGTGTGSNATGATGDPQVTITYNTPTPPTYIVNFNAEGGSAVAPITAVGFTNVTLPSAPTYPGYTFDGWFVEPEGGGVAVTYPYFPMSTTTLYAQWTPHVTDTVSFNAEGGGAVSSLGGLDGTSVTLPSAPTYPGYIFDGWFTAASGGSPLTSPYTLAGSVTLFAQWTAIPVSTPVVTPSYQEIALIHSFALGSSALTPALKSQIDDVVNVIEAKHFDSLILVGNATLPASSLNGSLAKTRASVVEAYMVQLGLIVTFKIEFTQSGTTTSDLNVKVLAK